MSSGARRRLGKAVAWLISRVRTGSSRKETPFLGGKMVAIYAPEVWTLELAYRSPGLALARRAHSGTGTQRRLSEYLHDGIKAKWTCRVRSDFVAQGGLPCPICAPDTRTAQSAGRAPVAALSDEITRGTRRVRPCALRRLHVISGTRTPIRDHPLADQDRASAGLPLWPVLNN